MPTGPTQENLAKARHTTLTGTSREQPREAIGIDAGDGLIFRYDEAAERLVGLTIVGVRARLAQRSAGR